MKPENKYALLELARQFDIDDTGSTEERLRELIKDRISFLIANDFNRLIMFLYKLDVSEKKLYARLELKKGVDAETIITDLIIERQFQKAQSRKKKYPFKKDDTIDEDEKW